MSATRNRFSVLRRTDLKRASGLFRKLHKVFSPPCTLPAATVRWDIRVDPEPGSLRLVDLKPGEEHEDLSRLLPITYAFTITATGAEQVALLVRYVLPDEIDYTHDEVLSFGQNLGQWLQGVLVREGIDARVVIFDYATRCRQSAIPLSFRTVVPVSPFELAYTKRDLSHLPLDEQSRL